MQRLPCTPVWVETYRCFRVFIVAVTCWMGLCVSAQAANHALIMWIGQYANPRANLPGIDLDAKAAREIAQLMAVPMANITELKNGELTLRAMSQAIADLTNRIAPGDKVFISYSGHGSQKANATTGGRKCSEGIVAHDLQLYFDYAIEADLAKLGAKASQVVVMNDSCFSGGASTKSLTGLVPKVLPRELAKAASATSSEADYACGDAVNKGLAKNLNVVPRGGAHLLYIAAAADNEVASASPDGSLATQAWLACLKDPATDTDRSGTISGEELRTCSQRRVDGNKLGARQHITLTGTTSLAVSFADASLANNASQVVPHLALRDIKAGSDKTYQVKLTPAKKTLKIGADALEFEVQTNREGYLYLFQVGSDGATVNLLFPNTNDSDNRLKAGTHKFPRAGWAIQAGGPKGTDHLMALLSNDPKDYAGIAKKAGIFAALPATRINMKNLVVVSTGADTGQQGRYGTSDVVQIMEVP